ncbi:HAMP domain-containing histidine kinase [Oscillibacter sp. MSJ-2]|uniref:histidine kinase n=2 Tax=Dysosmobacter acutus TaxID=2841504 RepID=A0ABS6F671_9FIRM|nr:HAMP domain-containing histidine kinase [Dysosmobacter acutus]
MLQYLVAMIVFVVGFVGFVLVGWRVCNSITWHGDELLYRPLQWVREYILLVGGLCLISGWAVITYFFFRKPLRYLDEVIAAAEQLAQPTDAAIVLPPAMQNVEDELNLVRQQALRDAQAAREAEQRKNDLVVYLAHDLKTPLTSVIGYLTLLRDEPQLSDALRCRYTGIALDKAERLEDLINEFFDITRFNLTHLELETSPVDLTRMLQQVASEFAPQFAEKQLTCRLDLPRSLVYDCDPDKLARVFDNLLRNAFYYSFPGTAVEITARQEKGEIALSFTNEGKTIPAEKLERIFEQFFRLDAARTSQTGGAGLGLAIAREIVELHGGRIRAHSADNRITFDILLPGNAQP